GRYVTGLILSPHKTLQGIYDLQVESKGGKASRRAMHAAVFEAGWGGEALVPRQRATIAQGQRGRGRGGLRLRWKAARQDRGPNIWGVKKAWDHVEKRLTQSQTVVTAVIANRALIDGVEVVVQQPDVRAEEMAYLQETRQESYAQMAHARGRFLELLH